MEKHTPGPWTRFHDNACSVQANTKKGLVTVAECGKAARDTDEVRANARLIAAAPELLAALEQAIAFITRKEAHQGCMNAEELKRAEEEFIRSVPYIETGRWAGDMVRVDLNAARAAIARAKGA